MGDMMRIISLGTIIAATVVVAACSHTAVAPAPVLAAAHEQAASAGPAARVPGEYVVTLGAAEKEGVIDQRYGRFGIKSISALGGGVYLLSITSDPGPQEIEALSRVDSRIKTVQPNYMYRADQSGTSAK
jgi:hypothetical protein